MSTPSHDAGHDFHGHAHNSRSFWTGSILAIILTIIPFWMVMNHVDVQLTTVVIFVLAIVQIIVHVVYFLHVDSESESGWTLLSFLFTALIVFVTIIGSIWVMYHLNTNMMPMGAPAATSAASVPAMPGMH